MKLIGKIKYSGILKWIPTNPEWILEKFQLPTNLIYLEPKDIHITLCHQNILKKYDKALKEMKLFPASIPIELEPEAEFIQQTQSVDPRAPGEVTNRSLIVNTSKFHSDYLRKFTRDLLKGLFSIDTYKYVCEFERQHHISLANPTGSPRASIPFTWRFSDKTKELDWQYPILPVEPVKDLCV